MDKPESNKLQQLCEFPRDQEWRLVYRATDHGFGYDDFNRKCSNQRNCLTIIKSELGNVFSGYTDAAWIKESRSSEDENAFLFSLINKDDTPLKMKCCEPTNAIRGSNVILQMYGSQGGGRDLCLSQNSNTNTLSNSNLGTSYKHPKYPQGSDEAKNFLAGSHKFKTVEIEMYCKEYSMINLIHAAIDVIYFDFTLLRK